MATMRMLLTVKEVMEVVLRHHCSNIHFEFCDLNIWLIIRKDDENAVLGTNEGLNANVFKPVLTKL
jgi:hypothetical protein